MKRPSLSDLSLMEKVGQILMVHQGKLMYKKVNGESVARTDEEMDAIMEKYQFGSIWGTGAVKMDAINMAEVVTKQITGDVYKETFKFFNRKLKMPMLVAGDFENGVGGPIHKATKAVGALSIGAADDEKLTFDLHENMAKELRAAGYNWRWGPVVDMPNRLNGISLGRSFSDDLEKMTKHAIAAIRGMEKGKIATTVKHFPGADPHEFRDSHFVTTMINLSLEEWEKTQGKAFQNLIDAGVMTIMTSHVAFPAIDDEVLNGKILPATFSKKIITNLLRDRMGFEGVVITDGFDMAGLTTYCSREEMLIRSINAGHDILLGVSAEDFDVVYNAVLDGRIPMERVDESCERVLALKEKIGLFDDVQEDLDMGEVSVKTAEINRKIAEKSITLLYDRNKLLPLSKEKVKNVAIISTSHVATMIKELEVMKSEFEARGAKVSLIENVIEFIDFEPIVEEHDLIIFVGYIGPHRPAGMPSIYDEVMGTYNYAFSIGNEKTLGVATGYPYMHYDSMQGANTFINIYSPCPESQIALVKALYGEIPFEGKSPVDIEPKLRYVYC